MTADGEFDFSSLADYRSNADYIEATKAAALVVFVSTGNWTQMPINPHSHSVKLNDGDSLKRFAKMQSFPDWRSLCLQSFTPSDANSQAQVDGAVSGGAKAGANAPRGFDDAGKSTIGVG